MLHPASREGAIAGINIATLFHLPVVPPGITPGPSHDATYDEVRRVCGVPPPNHDPWYAMNSTCCKVLQHINNIFAPEVKIDKKTTANNGGLGHVQYVWASMSITRKTGNVR